MAFLQMWEARRSMSLFFHYFSCLLLFLPSLGFWSSVPVEHPAVPLVLQSTEVHVPVDLVYCPDEYPSPSAPLLADIDETAFEEDTDTEEDTHEFEISSIFPYLPYGDTGFVSDLVIDSSAQGLHSRHKLSSPILRC
ncbi:hypothetical protein ACYOEI_08075 [Singulisphaera rosea]